MPTPLFAVHPSSPLPFNPYLCEFNPILQNSRGVLSRMTNKEKQSSVIISQMLLNHQNRKFIILNFFLMSRATISTKQDVSIKRQYLVKSNYEFAKDNNLKLNYWYDQLCNIFISHYSLLSGVNADQSNRRNQKQISNESRNYEFTKYLRNFMLDFTSIMKDISNYQIARLTGLKNDNQPQLQVFSRLIDKIIRNKEVVDEIELNDNILTDKFREIKSFATAYKKNLENPFNLYNQKYIEENSKKILNQIEEALNIIQKNVKQKQSIQEKVPQFQADYSKFKCKLVKNKYKILKKLLTFIQNIKYCLVQMTQLFKNCATNHKNIFLKVFQNSEDDITDLRQLLNKSAGETQQRALISDNIKWQEAIKSTLQVYCLQNDEVERAVSKLSQYFLSSLKNHEERRIRLREIINNICQFYDPNESPYEQLTQIYNINQKLQKKFNIILDRLNDILQMIKKSRKQCLKHGEIVLSLIRLKTEKGKAFLQNGKNAKNKDIIELVNELTFTHTKQHILSFYQSCIMTQTDLLDAIKITVKPRRKTLDSMEISHSLSTNKYLVQRKKPIRQQYWLWRDFKEQTNMNYDHYISFFNDFKKFSEQTSSKFITKNNIELQRYTCTMMNRKKEGQITLFADNIIISAKNVTLFILWQDILNIEQVSSFFNKIIVITTPQGKIQLTKFNSDTGTVIAAMKEAQQRKQAGSQTKVVKKRVVQLTADDIKQIQARKASIASKLPKMAPFRLIVQETFQNERIDEIYELIYSDKPFNFYGREQPCFFSYTGKKSGNLNWVAEKFDKPGPEFYSLTEGVTFANCPLFSTRKITYNHPMKPSNIPFMPKQSRNADQRQMYWISHEQLLYLIKSLTFQIPFADTFEVQLIHRITQIGPNVKIEIFAHVVFVKQTNFQSIILKNTDPELDENMLSFMGQVRKLIRLRKEVAKGAIVPQQPQKTAQPVQEKGKEDVGKLKIYNKVLIGGLLLLLILHWLSFG